MWWANKVFLSEGRQYLINYETSCATIEPQGNTCINYKGVKPNTFPSHLIAAGLILGWSFRNQADRNCIFLSKKKWKEKMQRGLRKHPLKLNLFPPAECPSAAYMLIIVAKSSICLSFHFNSSLIFSQNIAINMVCQPKISMTRAGGAKKTTLVLIKLLGLQLLGCWMIWVLQAVFKCVAEQSTFPSSPGG